jgi:hypothetical protein
MKEEKEEKEEKEDKEEKVNMRMVAATGNGMRLREDFMIVIMNNRMITDIIVTINYEHNH